MLLNSDNEALWSIFQTLTCVSSCLQIQQDESREQTCLKSSRRKLIQLLLYYRIILSSLGDN